MLDYIPGFFLKRGVVVSVLILIVVFVAGILAWGCKWTIYYSKESYNAHNVSDVKNVMFESDGPSVTVN